MITTKQFRLFALVSFVAAMVVGQGVESLGWPFWLMLATPLCLLVIAIAVGVHGESAETESQEAAPKARAESIQLRATRVSSR
jgi:membrane protein implicated in regulation of membrane protease activity